MSEIVNVVVVGSGPAGYTAALYAARANLSPLVFEGASPNLPGGQLMITSEVENFPGFPKGILGPELMGLFREQAERFGAIYHTENVVSVNLSQRPFEIRSESGLKVYAKTLIVATGANAKLLGIPKEKELMAQGGGVSACATCDGAFYKNQDVAVVGGGDTAMEEALFLTRFAKSVTLIHRRNEFRASKIMLDRVKSNAKITLKTPYEVHSLNTHKITQAGLEKDILMGVELKNTETNQLTSLSVTGLFIAIGHQPNNHLFQQKLSMDEKGYMKTLGKTSKTEIPGVFACGDVQDSVYRQAITAAGSGCMAAIDAERFLEENP